jgi:hypothetical protein
MMGVAFAHIAFGVVGIELDVEVSVKGPPVVAEGEPTERMYVASASP